MWKLIEVQSTDWIQDNSKHYTIISYLHDDNVRIDLMCENHEPIISFQGYYENVRKAFMQWLSSTAIKFSPEHISYCGQELCKAALLKDKYVQG